MVTHLPHEGVRWEETMHTVVGYTPTPTLTRTTPVFQGPSTEQALDKQQLQILYLNQHHEQRQRWQNAGWGELGHHHPGARPLQPPAQGMTTPPAWPSRRTGVGHRKGNLAMAA